MRFVIFLPTLALCSSAHAFQPVEAGLRPLLQRQQAITDEQHLMNSLLQSPPTHPKERADAYRTYVANEVERKQLACEIEQSRRWAASPLAMYATPASEAPCSQPIPSFQRAAFSAAKLKR